MNEGTGGTQDWEQPGSQQGAGTKCVAGLAIFSKCFKHRQQEEKVSLENPQLCACPHQCPAPQRELNRGAQLTW